MLSKSYMAMWGLLLPVLLGNALFSASAATINLSIAEDNGLSLADGTDLPAGSLLRIGYFRNSSTGVQLTDSQIQLLANSPSTLNSSFVEAGTISVGSGVGGISGHLSGSVNADTSSTGLNLEGKQIYLWVFNASTLGAATQQGIYYWLNTNTTTNPDGTAETPGVRWSFPIQVPPGVTSIELTDLTTGTSTLAAGAHVVVGSYPTGTSDATGAANFGLALIIPEPSSVTLGLCGMSWLLLRRRRRAV